MAEKEMKKKGQVYEVNEKEDAEMKKGKIFGDPIVEVQF